MLELNFSLSDCESMRGPCVYVALDEAGMVLYVGRSDHGVTRPFSRKHHVLSKHQPKALKLFPCESSEASKALEIKLISELHPVFNRPKRYQPNKIVKTSVPRVPAVPTATLSNMTGSELKAIRKQLGLTQGGFAEKLDVHLVTVANWERGFHGIPKTIALAAKYLVVA